MNDHRPVGYAIGVMVLSLGGFMLGPALIDAIAGNPDWKAFVVSSVLTMLMGGALTLGCLSGRGQALSIEQAFILTVFSWVALPLFGALPFVMGDPGATLVDSIFESVSGLTTTGATVFENLDERPPGVLLWRALLQWIGGIGIVVFAMAFLPTLQSGGMQLFRSEAFDTAGKVMSRIVDIVGSIFSIYLGLTLTAALVYGSFGMSAFDSLCHAMTTIATGGFANTDASFSEYGAGVQYSAVIFMILASLPFIRFVQLINGNPQPLFRDPQVKTFLALSLLFCLLLTSARLGVEIDAPIPPTGEIEPAGPGDLLGQGADAIEESFREALFNGVSIMSGTGYASADYNAWGPFAVSIFFLIGLIGGCAGSTSCSVKVFRYQVLAAIVAAELQRVRRPHGVFTPRYDGRPIRPDVVTSVLTFFFAFMVALAALTAALAWVGLDLTTALSGAASALANIGPGLGDEIGPSGNYRDLPDSAKLMLAAGMLLGRLELLSVLVLLTPAFWRR